MDYLVCALVPGVEATVLVDLWAIARRRAFGISPPNYGLVGRWFAHLARGRFRHESIAASSAVHGERVIGWAAQDSGRTVRLLETLSQPADHPVRAGFPEGGYLSGLIVHAA